ncbi:SDR family NAD(P)-dependent oxidoreductase [Spiroplasma chinense]|uniref:SDR family NAD(P)-dependent oxidoreductase n=1 Tax=Spiroplasma chinense TaxID=216932 RepID=A0A5B9Y435_9MOLU|nr:SDR family oxidoreductase [Spiroplasma chinense]QEH61791.1 SDR family NAD(P)-dependent oxidoreductase [Spiroplasma chinense]
MNMNLHKEKYALVTGASKGIGFGYCKLLLQKGFNLICIARDLSSINTLKEQYPNSDIKEIEADLSDYNSVYKVFESVKTLDIALLINNAGFGVWGPFKDTNLERELNMIDLNIKTLHIFTKLFVEKFIQQGYGRIINIGSIASFMPGPNFSSYFASKAYVLSLGQAINTELKKTKSKVRVVTICPGPIKTDFWKNSNFKENNKKESIKTSDTDKFCKKSLNKALKTKNKNYILVGLKNKLLVSLSKRAPQKLVLNNVYSQMKQKKSQG